MAPAYDMNPTLNEYQSLLINSYTNKSDLNELLNSCEEYMLQKQTGHEIISEVLDAIKVWRRLATRLGVFKREIEMFSDVLDERYKVVCK